MSVTVERTKACTVCLLEKPVAEFYSARCRECANAIRRERHNGAEKGPLLPAGPLQEFIRGLMAGGETHATIAAHTSNLGRPMSERQVCAIQNERTQITLDTADRVLLAHGRYVAEFYPLNEDAVSYVPPPAPTAAP